MLSLTAAERSCWITLLSYASANDNANETGTITLLSEEKLMMQAGISPLHEDWDQTKNVLAKFEKLSMITLDNETITIQNWKKRQGESMSAYERLKKYRQKKKNTVEKLMDDNDSETPNDTKKITIDKIRLDKKLINNIISNNDEISDMENAYNDDRFLFFWKEYPKKIGKGDAFRSWKKLKPSDVLARKIVESVRAHCRGKRWKEDEGKYIPNPATFLNQRRFDDEVVSSGNSKYEGLPQ